MSYFAKINDEGLVEQVIVADQEFVNSLPGVWVETFIDQPAKQYAGIGHGYDALSHDFKSRDVSVSVWKKELGKWVIPDEFKDKTKVHAGKTLTQLSTPEVRDILYSLCTTLGLIGEDGVIKNGVQAQGQVKK